MYFISILLDILYMIKFTILCLGKFFFRDDILLNNGNLRPIILIHGSGANNCEWKVCRHLIKKYLTNHPIYAINLSDSYMPGKMPNCEIEEYMNIAAIHLKEIYEVHRQPAILIGHSMGGLVAINLLDLYSEYIYTIITISSPLQGAPLLNYAPFKYILNTKRHKQMIPNSTYLQRLYEIIMANNKKILSIGSLHDIHVPNDYARIPVDLCSTIGSPLNHIRNTKYEHYTMSKYGHGSIVNNHEVWDTIKRWIKLI